MDWGNYAKIEREVAWRFIRYLGAKASAISQQSSSKFTCVSTGDISLVPNLTLVTDHNGLRSMTDQMLFGELNFTSKQITIVE